MAKLQSTKTYNHLIILLETVHETLVLEIRETREKR